MFEPTNPDNETKKTIATNVHMRIDEMMNFFASPDSLFKKYPLISAPLLIMLAQLTAYFTPIVNTLVPSIS